MNICSLDGPANNETAMFNVKCEGEHPSWIINAWDSYVRERRGTDFDYYDDSFKAQAQFEKDLGIKLNYISCTSSRYSRQRTDNLLLESISFKDEGEATLFVLRWS